MTDPKYSMTIRWSEEDGCFIVTVPELLGCTAHGDSYAEAAAEAETAMELWLETAVEMGREIPEPGAQRAPICSGCGLPMKKQPVEAWIVPLEGESIPAEAYRCFGCDHSAVVRAEGSAG